jgi:Xaa-Pro aminopeptidase
MKLLIGITCILVCGLNAIAQELSISGLRKTAYRHESDFLSPKFHAERRQALRDLMPSNSVAILFSNPVRKRSNDVYYDYHQDPNFYYLSGHTEPNSVLLIFKDSVLINTVKCKEVLFLDERITKEEIWSSRKLGTVEASQVLGIDRVEKNSAFDSLVKNLEIYNKIWIGEQFVSEPESKRVSTHFYLQQHFTSLLTSINQEKIDSKSLLNSLKKLREVKLDEELNLLRKAISISCEAHLELIKSLNAEMTEYQAQSIVEYVFKNRGAESVAYPTIAGSGENSCVLHTTQNRKKLKKQELLLTDAGAEYHGYAADITRTIPTDGEFSAEEKAIYEIVLAAQEAGIAACRLGNSFYASHYAAVKVIQDGLLKLEIIKESSEYRKYFEHGTSHYLGLDVHDVGEHGKLKAGTVLTVEPGIYIPEGSDCDKKWWNIGIRIEDNILVTLGEPENLSKVLPRNINEIEALMKEKGLLENQK